VSKLVAGAHDDGMHRANSMNWVKYRYKGQKYVDAVVHIVPSHKVRLAAALARVQIGVLATWLGVRRRFAAVSGDFNETLRDRWKVLGALSLIATGFSDPGGTFGDRDIDHWWFLKRQLKSRKVTVQAEALHGYHSDHRPLLVRIRRNR
jgi:endonuclease/exonuclease/phosphatase family metal-dependent hydrolase